MNLHRQNDGQPCGFKHRREPAARNKTAVSAKGAQAEHGALRISDDKSDTGSDEKMGLAMEQEIDQHRARGGQTSEAASVAVPLDVWLIRCPRAACKLMASCRAMHAADWQRHPPDRVQLQSSQ